VTSSENEEEDGTRLFITEDEPVETKLIGDNNTVEKSEDDSFLDELD